MELRALRSEDRDAAVALWVEADLTRPWNPPQADFDRAITGPSSAVLGAVVGDRVVGTVMVGHDGHRGWVYYLATATDRRRSGLGRILMGAAEDWLAQRGVPKVQLMVRATNDAALGFYERIGYGAEPVEVLSRWLDADAQARREAHSDPTGPD